MGWLLFVGGVAVFVVGVTVCALILSGQISREEEDDDRRRVD